MIKIVTKMLCMGDETFVFTLSSKKVHAAALYMRFLLWGIDASWRRMVVHRLHNIS